MSLFYSYIFLEIVQTYPSSLNEFPPELLRRVLEGKLLTSDMVDGRRVGCVQEEVVAEGDLLWVVFVLEVNLYRQIEACVAGLVDLVRRLLHHWNKDLVKIGSL